jgi:hypothetical protein
MNPIHLYLGEIDEKEEIEWKTYAKPMSSVYDGNDELLCRLGKKPLWAWKGIVLVLRSKISL